MTRVRIRTCEFNENIHLQPDIHSYMARHIHAARGRASDADRRLTSQTGTTSKARARVAPKVAPKVPVASVAAPGATAVRPSWSQSSTSRPPRQATTPKDDIPEFDRNKVSLDFPGSLFGPSVSLLIKTTKIVGDVIQNSAVRYQSFLRLFRPLFKGQFEIKGLDPPTTTTTTRAPATADNEVRRRRMAFAP